MVKPVDKTGLQGANPDSAMDAENVSALPGAKVFQLGPQTMLLDQDTLDQAALDQAALDRAILDLPAGWSGTADQLVSLNLEDLLPDDAGEVVLVAVDDLPINLLASESVTEAGIAVPHVTAGGMEVAGLHYYSFESGLTVYSPVDLLILDLPNG